MLQEQDAIEISVVQEYSGQAYLNKGAKTPLISWGDSPAPSADKAELVPAGKGKILKEPKFIFKEWAKRINLEVRVNKSLVGTPIL